MNPPFHTVRHPFASCVTTESNLHGSASLMSVWTNSLNSPAQLVGDFLKVGIEIVSSACKSQSPGHLFNWGWDCAHKWATLCLVWSFQFTKYSQFPGNTFMCKIRMTSWKPKFQQNAKWSGTTWRETRQSLLHVWVWKWSKIFISVREVLEEQSRFSEEAHWQLRWKNNQKRGLKFILDSKEDHSSSVNE